MADEEDLTTKTYYVVAQVIHGKLRLLGDLEFTTPEIPEQMARGLAQKGMAKHVVEVKVVSSWIG